MEPRDRFSTRRWLAAAATVVLLTVLAACGTAPSAEPDAQPGEFGTSAWNEATWR